MARNRTDERVVVVTHRLSPEERARYWDPEPTERVGIEPRAPAARVWWQPSSEGLRLRVSVREPRVVERRSLDEEEDEEEEMEKMESIAPESSPPVASLETQEMRPEVMPSPEPETELSGESAATPEIPPREETPVSAAPTKSGKKYTCQTCGAEFTDWRACGRHTRWCGKPQKASAKAPAPAKSAARVMAEEAVSRLQPERGRVTGVVEGLAVHALSVPQFDDSLVGWLQWFLDAWEAAADRAAPLNVGALQRDWVILRRLLERETT